MVKSCSRHCLVVDSSFKIKTEGLQVTIIDFSLSRARVSNRLFFRDLAKDEWLFQHSSEAKEEIFDQYYVYKKMRDVVENDWSSYHPETNLLWLQHVLVNLLSRLSKRHLGCKDYAELTGLCENLPNFRSAVDAFEHLLPCLRSD